METFTLSTSNTISIKAIINQCLKNDRAAQKLLYHSHKERLMSIAYRYTRDINMSQDFLQETFILIFKKLEQFDPVKGNFESWSSKILVNKILEYKRKRKELYFEDYTDLEPSSSKNAVIDKLTVQELKTEIELLPEIYRIILHLYFFEEYNHTEIAELLDIKASSSRSRLTRAKQLITARWQQLQNHQ